VDLHRVPLLAARGPDAATGRQQRRREVRGPLAMAASARAVVARCSASAIRG
jgi:hypothetical protein